MFPWSVDTIGSHFPRFINLSAHTKSLKLKFVIHNGLPQQLRGKTEWDWYEYEFSADKILNSKMSYRLKCGCLMGPCFGSIYALPYLKSSTSFHSFGFHSIASLNIISQLILLYTYFLEVIPQRNGLVTSQFWSLTYLKQNVLGAAVKNKIIKHYFDDMLDVDVGAREHNTKSSFPYPSKWTCRLLVVGRL